MFFLVKICIKANFTILYFEFFCVPVFLVIQAISISTDVLAGFYVSFQSEARYMEDFMLALSFSHDARSLLFKLENKMEAYTSTLDLNTYLLALSA